MLYKNFSGSDLRDFRISNKLSQAKVAKESSIIQAKISAFELGKSELSETEREKILKTLEDKEKVNKISASKKSKGKKKDFVTTPEEIKARKDKYKKSIGNEQYLSVLHNLHNNHINKEKKYKALSLFSGCGGLCLGFSAAGFDIVGTIEKDEDISKIHQENFKSSRKLANDITLLSHENILLFQEQLGQVDIVIGGPPCQGFSLSGKRDRFDVRNKLFENYIDVISIFKPKIALLENVQLLNSMKDENGYLIKDLIIERFRNLNYKVNYYEVNAKDYGVPQSRARVFFVAVREDLKIEPTFPKSDDQRLSFADACSDLEYLESGETSKNDEFHAAVKHPPHVIEWLWNVPEGKSAHENKDENLRPPSGYNTTYKRQVWNEEGSTVQTTFGMISGCRNVHPIATRSLTIREASRLQSFPDEFIFLGKTGTIRTAIGNAVPPLLAYKIADYFIKELDLLSDKNNQLSG